MISCQRQRDLLAHVQPQIERDLIRLRYPGRRVHMPAVPQRLRPQRLHRHVTSFGRPAAAGRAFRMQHHLVADLRPLLARTMP